MFGSCFTTLAVILVLKQCSTFYDYDEEAESADHLDHTATWTPGPHCHHPNNLVCSQRAGKNCPLVRKKNGAVGNEAITRLWPGVLCVCVWVGGWVWVGGGGVEQATYTEVVRRMKASLHRLSTRRTPGEHIHRILSATLHSYTLFSLQLRWVSSVVSFILLVHWTLAFQFSFNMNWRATRRGNKTLK